MYSQVHANRVLYRDDPQPGQEFRQIVVVELEQFQVRIFEGTVIQLDPKFLVENPNAEYFLDSTLKEALADAEKEFAQSVADGWKPYR